MARFFAWAAGTITFFFLMEELVWPRYFAPNATSYHIALAIILILFGVGMWIRPAVDHIIEPKKGDSRGTFMAFIVVVFALMSVVAFYAISRDWDTEKLGTLGDFIGGTLNPILTFFTFIALLFTIVLQQKELHAANEAKDKAEESLDKEKKRATRQQFEYTFFQMIGLHNDIVNALDIYFKPSEYDYSAGHEVKGRDCFKTYLENYFDKYRPLGEYEDEKQRLDKAYKAFWEKRQQDLSHYFRYLYNVLRFVFEYEDDIGDRFKYIKLLRAQLSDFELLVLFYTALHENGKNYVRYIEEYALFDNLPYEHVLSKMHLKMYSRKCYGSQADAVMAYADSLPAAGDF